MSAVKFTSNPKMPPYVYKVTVAFAWPNWPFICTQVFGETQPTYSCVSDSQSFASFGFSTPQTPADLGPLVRVELIPSEPQ